MKTFKEFVLEGNPLSQDIRHREKGIHKIIISAARKELTPKENKSRMAMLHKDLKDAGATFKKTVGVWKNAENEIENENSVVAHLPNDPDGKKIVSLGHELRKKHDQDAFIHRPPSGEGIAHNRDGTTDNYGSRTGYNKDNPYGETQYKPTRPKNTRPKITFTDETERK